MTVGYKEIWEVLEPEARQDATVQANIRQGERVGATTEEMLINMVKMLVAEKKAYFDQVVQFNQMYGSGTPLMKGSLK